MILYNYLPYERFYEPEHMKEVLADLHTGFQRYFPRFAPDKETLKTRYDTAIKAFEKDQVIYEDVLDLALLEEFEDDPGSFKGEFSRKYPIIRRSLQSRAAGMERYQASFHAATGQPMLKVVRNLATFAQNYRQQMTDSDYETIKTVEGFDLADLVKDGTEEGSESYYTVRGVIGGGIASHLLYHLYPNFFPNRSQNAIWSLYFLTERKKYGFEDDSEFLMINHDGTGTQQNYFYPYDLFTYYAFRLYGWLKDAGESIRCYTFRRHRYVYVEAFLGFVAECHQSDIESLRPVYEHNDF